MPKDKRDDSRLRPATMVNAARMAARGYRRERDLPVATGGQSAFGDALLALLQRQEAMLEGMRRRRVAEYRPLRHLQVLTALIAEGCGDTAPVTA